MSDEATVLISINPINDAPVLTAIGDQSFDEDQQLSLPISYTDYDGDTLSVTVTSSENNVSISLDGSSLNFSSTSNFNGSYVITVTVAESGGEYETSESFDITVNPVNDAPAMVTISNVTTLEETETTVMLNASDIDGDMNFSFSAESSSDLFTINVSGATLTVNPLLDKVGTGSISVTANDGNLNSASISFNVTIDNVNDVPVLSSIENPDAVAEDGENIVVSLSATDVDGDAVSFTVEAENIELFETTSVNGNTITLNPIEFH